MIDWLIKKKQKKSTFDILSIVKSWYFSQYFNSSKMYYFFVYFLCDLTECIVFDLFFLIMLAEKG